MVDLQAFLAELRRRRVIRALAVWGLLAFAVLQVYEPVMHGLHLPDWTLSFVVVVLGLGFPVTAALAWVFDLKTGGIERTEPLVAPAPGAPAGAPPRRLRLALLLLGLSLVAALPGAIYFFVWPGAGLRRVAPAGETAGQAPPSIAVLPLVNMSSDKEQEYFSDGLTEELLNLLAKVPGLRVAARTSSFAYKGKTPKMSEVGRELGVTTVLEGSVRRSGDQLRITTQLVNVADGYHLWSETYSRKVTDVFTVQDEIAAAVVGALKLKLLPQAVARAGRTESVEAHDLYLRGLYFWNLRTGDSLARAAEFFERAIQADPGYALAHVGLADAIEVRFGYAWIPLEPLQAKARAAALRALELDPGLGEAHASLGLIAADRFDYAESVELFKKAIALRPDYATAHHWYALALAGLGRHAEARQEVELALRLEPTSRVINQNAGWTALMARDYPRAERHIRATLDLAPDYEAARSLLAQLLAYQGRRAEALAELAKLKPVEENLDARAIVLALAGGRTEALRLASELEEISRRRYVPSAVMAPVWAALGDRERTFAALKRVCKEREGAQGIAPNLDQVFDGVRSDPRFGEILACLNLR